ncbi:MAG: c-type cytochrome [Planctomycetota bacterium]
MFKRVVMVNVLVFSALVLAIGGSSCPTTLPTPVDPAAYTSANRVTGGLLYDKWWKAAGLAEPTGDHPLWASRPDTTSNTRTGPDTWRCKECHGWDYTGVSGAYGTGSHKTGVVGIFGTTKTAQELFDLIKTHHSYGTAGLSDTNIWDLAKFAKEGLIDTNTIINSTSKAFLGTAATGQTLYANSIGTNAACTSCHGTDGKTLNFATPPETEYVGTIAADNPWELQHKIRFGNPGSAMPSLINGGGTNQNVSDLGAHCQTLPQS